MAAIKQETGGGTPSSSSAAAATAATPTTPQPTLQQQQFCVRWNSYQTNLQNTFPKLLSSEHFVDVTLACEAEMIKCHKVVLSACSTYFEKLLVQNPCQHPIIFMKDMKYAEMQALVDFMYRGEVNVTQDELPSLLRSAEALQIRGLCGSDQLLSQHYLGQQQQQHQIKADKAPLAPVVNGATTTASQVPDTAAAKKPEINGDSRTGTPTLRREMSQGSSTDRSEDGDSLEPQMTIKEDYDNDDSYYDNGDELMDTDFLEQEQTEEQAEEQDADLEDDIHQPGTSTTPATGTGATGTALSIFQNIDKSPDYAIANVSCQYNDGSPGGGIPSARRIRRSEAELRRAAECITRGQTFQTVSDQFNIPISTIRFYMARKGILPRRKRGRACSAPGGPMSSPGGQMSSTYNTSSGGGGGGGGAILGVGHGTPLSGSGGFHNAPGNTSPSGPPYHIVHYKLPVLGAKLK